MGSKVDEGRYYYKKIGLNDFKQMLKDIEVKEVDKKLKDQHFELISRTLGAMHSKANCGISCKTIKLSSYWL